MDIMIIQDIQIIADILGKMNICVVEKIIIKED